MTASSETTPDQPGCAGTRTHALFLTVVTLALGARLFHFLTISETPFLKFPLVSDQSDMYAFWQWSHAILAGDWLGRDTYHPDQEWRKQIAPMETWYHWWGGKAIYHQAPAYPYFLAGLLMVKDSLKWVIAVQLLLGAVQIVILFSLARQLFDERAALLAAAITAWYGPFVFYEGVLLRDWLPPILEPLILLLVVRAKNRNIVAGWLLAGAVMGLAALTKETSLAVTGMAVLWLLRQLRRECQPVMRSLCLMIAAFAMCLLPLVMRNMLVGAPAFAISVQGPGSIIIGLSADSVPVGYYFPPSLTAAREAAGASSLHALAEAFRSHEGNLLGFFRLQLLKLRGIIDPFEVPNNLSYTYGQEISPLLSLMIGYGLVFPLGAAGLLFLWRWPNARVLYWYFAATLLVQLVTFTVSRFRLAFVPVLILAGAALLIQLFDALRETRLREAGTVAATVFVIILIQQLWVPLDHPTDSWRAVDHVSAASVYLREHRFDLALEEIARSRQLGGTAFEANSSNMAILTARIGGDAHLQWAFQLLDQNQAGQARTHIELAERSYAALPQTNMVSYNLGLAYLRLKERERARAHFMKFLEEEPTGPLVEHVTELLRVLDAGESAKSSDRSPD